MLHYLDTVIAFAVVMLVMSLVITLLNQMVSSVLSYRGSNLRWGIQTMLTTLSDRISGENARKIADEILTHPMISDSIFTKFENKLPGIGFLLKRRKLATWISSDTLVRTLAGVSERLRAQGSAESVAMAEVLKDLLAAKDGSAERKLQMVKDTIGTILTDTNYGVQVNELMKELGTTTRQSVGKIEAWFNIVVGRVSQRFTTQMRIWTIIFAFLLAFGIHLDSIDLIQQLLTNPATVQNLVDQSGAVMSEAEAIMGTQTANGARPTASTVAATVFTDQMKELLKEVTPEESTPALGNVPAFRSVGEAEKWLNDNLNPAVKPERRNQLLGKYKEMVLTGLGRKIGDLNRVLKETGVQIIPDHEPIRGPRSLVKFLFSFKSNKNLLGILLSSGLLALGAPFWYNTLKDLTNLRPTIASKQEEQKPPTG